VRRLQLVDSKSSATRFLPWKPGFLIEKPGFQGRNRVAEDSEERNDRREGSSLSPFAFIPRPKGRAAPKQPTGERRGGLPCGRRRSGPGPAGGGRNAQLDVVLMLLATYWKVLLVAEPRALMVTRQTTMIKASITAYSTAVGPSSFFKNAARRRERRDAMGGYPYATGRGKHQTRPRGW